MSTETLTKPIVEKAPRIDYHSLVGAGDALVIGRYPGDPNSFVGLCTVVSDENICGITISDTGDIRPFDGLYYIKDPVLDERPLLMDEPDLGVFDLAPTEKLLRSVAIKQKAQDELLADLTVSLGPMKARITRLETKITNLDKAGK